MLESNENIVIKCIDKLNEMMYNIHRKLNFIQQRRML